MTFASVVGSGGGRAWLEFGFEVYRAVESLVTWADTVG